jgi:glutamate--cysteine ligase catalytic subunit
MGLLTEGKPLSSEETLALSAYIREHGITQFLTTWNRVKDIQDDELRFGDEIEVGILRLDHQNKTVRISVRSAELQSQLEEKERRVAHQNEGVTWHPEFGAWMIESTPSRPYVRSRNVLVSIS